MLHLLPLEGFVLQIRTRKAKMINRLSCIAVTTAFLMVAIAQAQARTSEVCSEIDCQQGTCVPLSNNSYPSNILSPYQCKCNPGWQTLEGLLANLPRVLTLPCTIPNCTLNLGCGGTPASPVPASLTLEHVSSPCSLPGICGHGECVVTDLTKYPPMYKCSCQLGYANVGNLTAGYCLKHCEVGSNCRAIGISLPSKSAGSWEALVVSSFKITVAVVSALVFSATVLINVGMTKQYRHLVIFMLSIEGSPEQAVNIANSRFPLIILAISERSRAF